MDNSVLGAVITVLGSIITTAGGIYLNRKVKGSTDDELTRLRLENTKLKADK